MTAAGDRPQDVGRKHRAGGDPSPATTSLLGDYQEAMRQELRDVLAYIAGGAPTAAAAAGLGLATAGRPSLQERTKAWDLAIKLGRELATEIDPGGQGPGAPPAPAPGQRGPGHGRGRARIDYGPDR